MNTENHAVTNTALDENRILEYGHYISLEVENFRFNFLMCDGFTSKTVCIREVSNSNTSSIYDRCLFRIYPNFST